MLNRSGGADRDLSSLRLVLSAGEALPPELYGRWKEKVDALVDDMRSVAFPPLPDLEPMEVVTEGRGRSRPNNWPPCPLPPPMVAGGPSPTRPS